MFPVVYTPTEADAIAEYSHLYRRSEGLYLTLEQEESMEEDFLDACEGRDLDLVSESWMRATREEWSLMMLDCRFRC